jgi:hypothetical protein
MNGDQFFIGTRNELAFDIYVYVTYTVPTIKKVLETTRILFDNFSLLDIDRLTDMNKLMEIKELAVRCK